jgi:hypothetical protein
MYTYSSQKGHQQLNDFDNSKVGLNFARIHAVVDDPIDSHLLYAIATCRETLDEGVVRT